MNSIKLGILGDVFPTWCNEELFAHSEMDKLISPEIKDILEDNDINVCNLEGVFFDEENEKQKDGVRIKASTEAVAGVKGIGITAVSLANNHIMDYGKEGYLCTIEQLERYRISYFGAGININEINDSYSFSKDGLKVTVMSVSETMFNVPGIETPGANIYDEYYTCKRVEELKADCDYLVVLYHGGSERFRYVTESVKTRFHRMAKSGADIIIAQHSHCIGLEEKYENSYLLYGQGNFLFHYTKEILPKNKSALMLVVEFADEGFEVRKYRVDRSGPGVVISQRLKLPEFRERSKRLAKGDNFIAEFSEYAAKELINKGILEAFRGDNPEDKKEKEENPEGYEEYLISQFSTRQLYRIYRVLQSEEFREITMQAIGDILNKRAIEGGDTEFVSLAGNASPEEMEMFASFHKYGISESEFKMFCFPEKTEEERRQYISVRNEKAVLKKAFRDSTRKEILKSKFATYKMLGKYYKRELILCKDRDDFIDFAQKRKTFFIKPNKGTGGKDVKYVDLLKMGYTPELYYDEFLGGEDCVAEEVVKQSSDFEKIYAGSVNTVRVVTYLRNDEFKILFSTLRIGGGGSELDSLSAGGMTVEIDSDAGVIISDAVRSGMKGLIHEHPDTREVFRTRVIPRWEELVKVVEEAARLVDDPPIIGWDMALTDEGWVMIDANWLPSFRDIQALRKKGQREFFERETGLSFAPNPKGY